MAVKDIQPRIILCNVDNIYIIHYKIMVVFPLYHLTWVYYLGAFGVIARVFVPDMVKSSMLDPHYRLYVRGILGNCTVTLEHRVSWNSSHHNLIRCSACFFTGIIRAYCQVLESVQIAAMISSVASHAIALLFSEPTVSCWSLHIWL